MQTTAVKKDGDALRLELLAPARDLRVAMVALDAGADAVFIGGPALGARAAAGNSMEDIASLCASAHRCGARVHLTLNTLLQDRELDTAQQLIYQAADCGVDALIVQDMAVFTLDIPPNLELHASTQCNIDSIDKLKFFAELGCAQAVLPRELSLEEIKAFHEACPQIRLEVFVAGALCVGQSGICYISELMTGRSANRGACAQICRLPMELISPEGKVIKSGHLLSLKDNLALHQLPELIACGVTSFKIEGRLKDELYVKNQCVAFSQQLDAFIHDHPTYARSSIGQRIAGFIPDVSKTFNRGFTAAYLAGSNDRLYADKSPKFIGESCAQVIASKVAGQRTTLCLKVKPGLTLHNGDAFTFFAADGTLQGFRVNRVDPHEGRPNCVNLQLNTALKIPVHTNLRRNVDIAFDKALQAKDSVLRQVALNCSICQQENRLTLSFGDELGRLGRAEMMVNTAADAAPLPPALLKEKCARLGSAHHVLMRCTISAASGIKLTISQFNALRRAAFAAYLAQAQQLAPRSSPFKLPVKLPHFPDKLIDARLCLNARAREFYQRCGAKISPTASHMPRVLMTCRNCLIKNYARCYKDGGTVSGFKLKIGNNIFKLRCQCKVCRMQILED